MNCTSNFPPCFFDELTFSKLARGLQLISIHRNNANENAQKQAAGAGLSFSPQRPWGNARMVRIDGLILLFLSRALRKPDMTFRALLETFTFTFTRKPQWFPQSI